MIERQPAGFPDSRPQSWDEHQAALLIATLRRVLTDGAARPLRLVGTGFSTVVVGDEEIVCRVPVNHEAARAQSRLVRLLPLIAPHLSMPIPAPLHELPASVGLPFGALVMRRLPGKTLAVSCTSTTVAETLTDLLIALHELSIPRTPATLLLRHDRDDADRDIWATALPAFQSVASSDERRAAARWWDAYDTDPVRRDFQPAIVHGDFWHENMLVDASGDRVTGILDWENCGIGDPAMDLASLWHANPILFADVLTGYAERTGGSIEELRRRACWQFGRREWVGLARTVRADDAAEFPDAIGKVRAVLREFSDRRE